VEWGQPPLSVPRRLINAHSGISAAWATAARVQLSFPSGLAPTCSHWTGVSPRPRPLAHQHPPEHVSVGAAWHGGEHGIFLWRPWCDQTTLSGRGLGRGKLRRINFFDSRRKGRTPYVLTDRLMLRRQAGPARVGFVCQRSLPWLGRSSVREASLAKRGASSHVTPGLLRMMPLSETLAARATASSTSRAP
jgi:hypothetical protein